MIEMEIIKNYVQQHKERFVDELIELLKIPSVSADSAYSQDVLNTAETVKDFLKKAGCDTVEICETPGYPIVYGERKSTRLNSSHVRISYAVFCLKKKRT